MRNQLRILFLAGLILLGTQVLTRPSGAMAQETPPAAPPPKPAFVDEINALVGQIQRVLAANAVLGQPLEIRNRTIVPIVSLVFGFGSGSGGMPAKESGVGGGGGGWLSPESLLIVTEDKVEVVAAKTGFVSEVIKALAPIIRESIQMRRGGPQTPEGPPQPPPQ